MRRREDAGGELSAELPETARQVLEAARRIVSERGLAALTLDAVAEESGDYRSAIRYHFGDKAGLCRRCWTLRRSPRHDPAVRRR